MLMLAALLLALGTLPTQAQTGGTSPGLILTLVVDTTGSMGGVIDDVKACITRLVNRVATFSPAPTAFVLVDYKDVGDEFVTRITVRRTIDFGSSPNPAQATAQAFLQGTNASGAVVPGEGVNALEAGGGGDCPEQGTTGVRRAVREIERIRSPLGGLARPAGTSEYLYYFTDADNHRPLLVESDSFDPAYPDDTFVDQAARDTYNNFLRPNAIKIFPVLFNGCFFVPTSPSKKGSRRHPGRDQDSPKSELTTASIPDEFFIIAARNRDFGPIAGNNGSQVFPVGDPSNAELVCNRLEKTLRTGVRLAAARSGRFVSGGGAPGRFGTPVVGTVDIPFNVDATVTSILASVVADSLSSAQLIRPNGTTVLATDAGVTIDVTSTLAFINVENPDDGAWIFRFSGSGAYSAAVEVTSVVGFTQVAFVRDEGGSLVPIGGQPLTGQPAILLVQLEGPFANATFRLVDEAGAPITGFNPLTMNTSDPRAPAGAFVASFTPPSVPFRVEVRGTTTDGTAYQRLSETLFKTQNVGLEITGTSPTTISPGGTATFTYTLRNVGPPGTFNLSAGSTVGTATVSPTSLTLGTGETGTATVTVTIPAGTPPNTPVIVTVTATNAADSTSTNSASAVLNVSSGPVPPAPSNLRVTAVTTNTVSLAWTDNSEGVEEEDIFQIERLTGSVTAIIGAVGRDVTSFTDTGLSPNTTYFYRVRAQNSGGSSAWSNQVAATTFVVAPAPPTNVIVVPVSANSVRVSFTGVSGATSYLVQRRCDGEGSFTTVSTLSSDVTSVVISPVDIGRSCEYRVIAVNAAGQTISSTVTVAIPIGGRIAVSPKRLSFNVSRQQVQQFLRFTVQNSGFDPLFVTINQPGGEFQVVAIVTATGARTEVPSGTAPSLELAPGERRIIEVRFLPTLGARGLPSPGRRSADLILTHTDPTTSPSGLTVVRLTGNVPKGRVSRD